MIHRGHNPQKWPFRGRPRFGRVDVVKTSATRVVDALSSWATRPGALHERLTAAIQDAIRQGSIYPGMRLPAERHLASMLAVSRTTVVTCYNDLRARGWLESRVGSGTWVSKKKAGIARSTAYAAMVARSPLLNVLQAPETGAIDFATMATQPLAELITPFLNGFQANALTLLAEREYMPFGLPALRETVAAHFTMNETPTSSDQVLITTGGQQAISLICLLLLQRGDHVLVENPTYFGALEALRISGARIAPVAIEKDHVSPEILSQRIAAVSPRMIYLTPSGQNPTGAMMPEISRAAIAKAAVTHGVTIVEDEVLADFTASSRRPRSIASFAPEANVLTIGSVSKLFWPGLRVGWIRGPRHLIGRLTRLKTATDLGSSLLPQMIAVELLDHVDEARAIRRSEFTSKRKLITGMMRQYMPHAEFVEPRAGLCLWVRTREIDTQVLAQAGLRNGVVLSPGNMFSVDESHREFLRIPFVLDEDSLTEGVRRLATAMRELGTTCEASNDFAFALP